MLEIWGNWKKHEVKIRGNQQGKETQYEFVEERPIGQFPLPGELSRGIVSMDPCFGPQVSIVHFVVALKIIYQ